MTAGPSARFFRNSDSISALVSFITSKDEGDGVPWWMMRSELVLSDDKHRAEHKEYRELRKKTDEKTAWKEIKGRRSKYLFSSKDQLYRTLRLCRDFGILTQDHANGPYRVTKGGLTTTVREREIYYLRNIPLERVMLGEGKLSESIYGLTTSDLAPSEVAELDEIRAKIQRLGEDLMMLQCRVLERRFAGHKSGGNQMLESEGSRGLEEGAGDRLCRAKMQLREEITDGIARRLKRAKNKQRLILKIKDVQREFDIPVIAVVSPEVHAVLRHEIVKAGPRASH
ncbi:MAG: hypothetical protein WAS24_08345 [Thermoplasmata archaeon]